MLRVRERLEEFERQPVEIGCSVIVRYRESATAVAFPRTDLTIVGENEANSGEGA
jgi:hypothetical protein